MSDIVFALVALGAAFGSGLGVGAVLVSRTIDRDEYSAVMWRSLQAATRLHGAYWAARDAIHREVATHNSRGPNEEGQ